MTTQTANSPSTPSSADAPMRRREAARAPQEAHFHRSRGRAALRARRAPKARVPAQVRAQEAIALDHERSRQCHRSRALALIEHAKSHKSCSRSRSNIALCRRQPRSRTRRWQHFPHAEVEAALREAMHQAHGRAAALPCAPRPPVAERLRDPRRARSPMKKVIDGRVQVAADPALKRARLPHRMARRRRGTRERPPSKSHWKN